LTRFAELGRRWLPILNAFDELAWMCFELHPGEDCTMDHFERFWKQWADMRGNILYDRAT